VTTTAFRSTHIEARGEKETAENNVLPHRILVDCNAYDEYVFVAWLNKSQYQRTVWHRDESASIGQATTMCVARWKSDESSARFLLHHHFILIV
jgi:hypothetical protein